MDKDCLEQFEPLFPVTLALFMPIFMYFFYCTFSLALVKTNSLPKIIVVLLLHLCSHIQKHIYHITKMYGKQMSDMQDKKQLFF